LLEFQVVALNAPTQLGDVDQALEGDKRLQPIRPL
jgi:hypothetical protein